MTEELSQSDLAEEMAVYLARKEEWIKAGFEGFWVLIKGQTVKIYSEREGEMGAVRAGYDHYGIVPFLVRQILRKEPVYQMVPRLVRSREP